MEKSARTRMTTAMVLTVVFATGLLLGMAVDRSAAGSDEPGGEVTQAAREDDRPRRTPMYEQVGPSQEQHALIDSIVEQHTGELRALRREFRDAYEVRTQGVVERTREAIKRVLTPEQAEKYDSLVVEYEKRRAERGSRENQD